MIYQFLYFLGALLTLPFSPFLAFQGRKVRASVPELPEAAGPRQGVTGQGATPLSLLTLGESTIAGVGVENHEQGFTGHLAACLHQATGRPVEWQVLARSGVTARGALSQLAPFLPSRPLSLIVIGLGGNDTFTLNSPLRWRSGLIRLVDTIRAKHPNVPILINNLPPVGHFPAFPVSLQLVLGGLVWLHGKVIRDLPGRFDGVFYMKKPVDWKAWRHRAPAGAGPGAFFSDGVHPSALTYRLWAEEAGAFVMKEGIL